MENYNEKRDEDLIRISRDNPRAFEVLISRYEAPFFRKALGVMRDDSAAKDAVQDALVKIYLNALKFQDNGEGSFKAWGYRVLMNTLFTAYKKRKDKSTEEFDEVFAEIIPDAYEDGSRHNKELADYINSVLKRMPENFSKVLVKFFLEDKSQEQIAEEEGLSLSAVKTRVYRAKEAFRNVGIKF